MSDPWGVLLSREGRRLRSGRTRTSEAIVQLLRELIITGQLKAGTPLRVHGLTEKLGISATPVREALLLLESEGLLESELHRGFRVKGISIRDIEDVFTLHAIAAGKLAERATPLLTPLELEELSHLDRSMREAIRSDSVDFIEELNFRFHRLINRAARSPLLTRYLLTTGQYVPRRFVRKISGWVETSATGHGKILEALQQRDAIRARVHMEDHIRTAGRLLIAHLERSVSEGEASLDWILE